MKRERISIDRTLSIAQRIRIDRNNDLNDSYKCIFISGKHSRFIRLSDLLCSQTLGLSNHDSLASVAASKHTALQHTILTASKILR